MKTEQEIEEASKKTYTRINEQEAFIVGALWMQRIKTEQRLKESIEKASINLNKIKDVDKWIEEVKGEP